MITASDWSDLSRKILHHLKSMPYRGNHCWAIGYFVDTAGVDAEIIRKYVKYQEKREKDQEDLKFD